MDAFLGAMPLEALSDAWIRQAFDSGTRAFLLFTLIAARLSGLFVIAPVFGHPDIPLQIRVFVVLSLSLLLTPALLASGGLSFDRLDVDRDGLLSPQEIPVSLERPVQQLRYRTGKPADEPFHHDEFRLDLPLPKSVVEYACLSVGEFGIGLALGLGMLTLLSGLQMAGQMIDQQTGVSLGEVFNPDLDVSVSLSGEMLYLLGTTLFLIVGGHLLAVRGLIETFQSLPVGFGLVSLSTIEFLSRLVHDSLVLSIMVSAPLMACMSVIGIAMGFLGHTIPQINVLVVGFPIRMFVGLLLFWISLPAIGEFLGTSIPDAVEQLKSVIMGQASLP